MQTSYCEKDVCLLLKDITGMVTPMNSHEREKRIQSGVSYSEMIPEEYEPTQQYIDIFHDAIACFSEETAMAVSIVANEIIRQYPKGVVLISLARAGTPIGILIKRYINKFFSRNVPHYSISIIRGKGIDHNALHYILKRYSANEIVFIDGWTGKGAISTELKVALNAFLCITPKLAVLSDPARAADIVGTYADILIPSACLNATVSGLISRTFHRKDLIGENDFHGAVYFREQKECDLSYRFIEAIEEQFVCLTNISEPVVCAKQENIVNPDIERIATEFNISNTNFIKPSIGETTRVLLRRVPWKILVDDRSRPELRPILRLAEERNVEVLDYPLKRYKACGLVKTING
jgi:hypothetical protein